MAYITDESGRSEVYVRSFPGPEGKWRVSTGGGFVPCWRADGRELFYYAPDGKLMTVEVKPGAGFEFAPARSLFAFPPEAIDFDRFNYDVTPDGQRFLANLPHGREAPPSITLVFNWTAELGR
jgi:eukaryotic-like serine/threonine-protein kinase